VTDDDTVAAVSVGPQIWSESNMSIVPTGINNVLNTDYWKAYVGTNGSGNATDDEDGYYYTWDAAQNVCPIGWSLPSDSDWKVLEGNLGMSTAQQDAEFWRGTDQGTQLKEGGTSGFEAKLAGHRYFDGSFHNRGDGTSLWSSTASGPNAYRRALLANPNRDTVDRGAYSKGYGFSVRCLKD
jgi:uncharacterized protein (TIGR02145 family)